MSGSARPLVAIVKPSPGDPQLGALFAPACSSSGHTTRDRYERFRERNHLDESGD